MKKSEAKIYLLKVTLLGTEPSIWRRFLVPENLTLLQLHQVLQVVMGWQDAHLHQFVQGKKIYSIPDAESFMPVKDETRVPLNRLLQKQGDHLLYEYDFGDDWKHEVRLEEIMEPDPDMKSPVCLDGERTCPPEDCGGVWGYADMLQILSDPEDPEYEETMEWLGEDFDPEEFDVEEVNDMLKNFRL